jgi:alkaline phosphatase D
MLLCAAVMPAQYTQWVTHGPMLGRPGARSMGVWVRTAKPGAFYVRYGPAPDRLTQVSKPGATKLEADHTGWVTIDGLQPDTRYHFAIAFTPEGEPAGLPGSFKTLPSSDVTRHPTANPDGLYNFTFEFACGNNQSPRGNGPALPVFRTMMDRIARKLDFAILNGDWLYEERRGHPIEAWMAENAVATPSVPPLLRLIPTVAGVWENYKLYLSRGPNLSEWHRNVASYYTFDDHEILNDVFGAGEIGLRNRRAVFRDISTKAWYDYLGWSNPTPWRQGIVFGRAQLKAGSDILTDASADFTKIDLKQLQTMHVHWGGPNAGSNEIEEPGDPNAGVYRVVEVLDKNRLRIFPAPKANTTPAYSIGRLSYFAFPMGNAEFFVLDARSHRNMHDLKNPNKPGISLLGREQKQWVKDAMRASRAQFLFVVSSVNFMIPHTASSGEGNKDDAWTAFLEEREEMIRFWDSLGKTVLILTGDIHMSYTLKITDRVWEVASGPHNSPHHPVGGKGYPPNGEFDSRGRKCDIRWTSYLANDSDRALRRWPLYTVVKVNNVFSNPEEGGKPRWLRWPRPYVSVQHYDGRSGDLLYAETVHAAAGKKP